MTRPVPTLRPARAARPRPVTPRRPAAWTVDALVALDPAPFEPALRRALGRPDLRVARVEPLDGGPGASIVGTLAAHRFGRAAGVHHRRLHHAGGATDVVVKIKPTDGEVELMLGELAAACGPALGAAFAAHPEAVGFRVCHRREPGVYALADAVAAGHLPRLYAAIADDARGTHALLLERLDPARGVRLLDSADDPSGWGEREVEAALVGLGALHARWLGRERALAAAPGVAGWLGVPPTAARRVAARPLWQALKDHAFDRFPTLADAAGWRRHQALLDALPAWWTRLEAMPRTLAHADCNPRNVCLRGGPAGALALCAYDWELATVHLPQRDAAELLAFVLPPDAPRAAVVHWVERHRRAVADAGVAVPDAATWRRGFALALADLLVDRFALYAMGHAAQPYAFLPRAFGTLHHLLALGLEGA